MKIKVKLFDKACKFDVIKKGEWIDLRNAEIIELKAPFANVLSKGRTVRTVEFDYKLIPLGIGMKLPKGIEAHICLPARSCFTAYRPCRRWRGIWTLRLRSATWRYRAAKGRSCVSARPLTMR